MKALIVLLLAIVTLPTTVRSASPPTALDLVGKWDGTVEFGKFKFKLVLNVAKKPDGRLNVTIDNPDQGQKGMPINALLFNNPDVRLEIDQFGTSYLGKLSSDLNQIDGAFEEGPGGRPIAVVFKRSHEPDLPEPVKTFTFAKGEPMDIRGYWKGSLEPMPGMKITVALNIGRIPDGTFRAAMDIFDQGAKDIPAVSATFTNGNARLEWSAFQTVYDAKLSEDGKNLAGAWKGGGRSNQVSFVRLESPATMLPKDISFTPEKSKADDVRGYWLGTLEVPGRKLRLAFKVGKVPDGSYAGTLASLDQGGQEIPMTTAAVTAEKVVFEWKGMRAKFEAKINSDGTLLDGTWEQFGNPLPLKMERTPAPETGKKT
jgi:hypothetical protein